MCPPDKQDETKYGGGIYAANSSLTLLNNVIRNNVSRDSAPASMFRVDRKLVIRGNIIRNNIGVSKPRRWCVAGLAERRDSRNRIMGNEIGRDMGYGWGGGMLVVKHRRPLQALQQHLHRQLRSVLGRRLLRRRGRRGLDGPTISSTATRPSRTARGLRCTSTATKTASAQRSP